LDEAHDDDAAAVKFVLLPRVKGVVLFLVVSVFFRCVHPRTRCGEEKEETTMPLEVPPLLGIEREEVVVAKLIFCGWTEFASLLLLLLKREKKDT
jgi:hypothetical protein|tara:strand:- start:133 stop:417 length:285 start_codon:yes stop_codon:yes gene_type:complete